MVEEHLADWQKQTLNELQRCSLRAGCADTQWFATVAYELCDDLIYHAFSLFQPSLKWLKENDSFSDATVHFINR